MAIVIFEDTKEKKRKKESVVNFVDPKVRDKYRAASGAAR